MKKLAVVISGWHFPYHFYKKIKEQKIPEGWQVDCFIVSHRDPSYAIEEKKNDKFRNNRRGKFDRILYGKMATVENIEELNWHYSLEPNTIGDWGASNQWLEKHNYKDYDLFLFSHDDNFILTDQLFVDVLKNIDWLILTNSVGTPPGNLRGSFEFFTREMMDLIGGKFDLSMVTLTRENEFITDGSLSQLGNWNNTITPLKDFIKKNGLADRIVSLSQYYRMGIYCLEGERGYIDKTYKLNTKQEEKGLDLVEEKYNRRFKRIIYLANINLFSDWAHSIQIMKMCEVFVENENKVELVIRRRKGDKQRNIYGYYNIENRFKIKRIPCIDFFPGNTKRFLFLIKTLSFLLLTRMYLLFKKFDILYTRESLIGLFFLNFYLEIHDLPKKVKNWHMKVWRRAKKLIVITNSLKEDLVKIGLPENKILVAPDGVDLEKFNIAVSQKKACEKLNLPLDKKIILYSGSLFWHNWKGVDVLLEAMKYLSEDYLVVLVGGEKEEVEKIKKIYNSDKLLLIGRRPHEEIPCFLKAADVLVLPNKKGKSESEKYTSPLKLFEYMASGRPIVASNLPSIREILNESNAVLVEPNDPEALAEGIKKIFQNSELAAKISEQAFRDVQNYTWEKRAEKIQKFITICL